VGVGARRRRARHLPWTGDPDDPAVGPLWEALSKLEFEDEEHEPDEPTGLAYLERSLFAPDRRSPAPSTASLSWVARGRRLGLILAREVVRRLEDGVAPDEILVLVRAGTTSGRASEILDASGVPSRASVLDLSRPTRHRRVAARVDDRAGGLGDIAARPTPPQRPARPVVVHGGRAVRDGVDPGRGSASPRRSAIAVPSAGPRRNLRKATVPDAPVPSSNGRPDADRPGGPLHWAGGADRLRDLAEVRRLESERSTPLGSPLDDHALIRDIGLRRSTASLHRAVESIAGDLDAPRPESRPRPPSGSPPLRRPKGPGLA